MEDEIADGVRRLVRAPPELVVVEGVDGRADLGGEDATDASFQCFQAENCGELGSDGRLNWKGRVESILHLVMRWRRLREWEIVLAIWGIEAALCTAVILAVAAGL